MDTRAVISGSLAGLAVICGTILAALDRNPDAVVACYGLASTSAGYAVGLYSEPVRKASNETAIETTEGGNDEA